MQQLEPLTRMRKAIVKSMTSSAAIPQFAVEMTVDVSSLAERRAKISVDRRPSYADALVASVAAALRDHPTLNASFTNEGILKNEEINIALAIALDDGVISPVITAADRRSLGELAIERERISSAARERRLKAEDILSATFTISNLGPLGVRRFNALVVPPQAAILAVGAIEDGTMALTLSVDHRVVDGAPAALYLRQVCSQLEDDAWLASLFEPPIAKSGDES